MSLNLADGTGEFLRLRRELPALTKDHALANLTELAEDAGLEALIERIPLTSQNVEPLRLEQESFLAAIQGQQAPAVSGREGRDALAVTLSIEARIMNHVADSRTQ